MNEELPFGADQMNDGIRRAGPTRMEVYKGPAVIRSRHGGSKGYDPDVARQVLRRLSNGHSLIDICREEAVEFSAVIDWSLDNPYGFSQHYARARLSGCHYMNEECLQITDDGRNDWMKVNDPDNDGYKWNGEGLARSKLRVEQRRWFLGKIAPKVYGDKLDLTVNPSEARSSRVDLSQATPAQLEAIEQAARACAAVGVRIQILGL